MLRGEWGFEGTVVSDYFAVKQLFEYHHLVGSADEAAALALGAGIDVELPSYTTTKHHRPGRRNPGRVES